MHDKPANCSQEIAQVLAGLVNKFKWNGPCRIGPEGKSAVHRR